MKIASHLSWNRQLFSLKAILSWKCKSNDCTVGTRRSSHIIVCWITCWNLPNGHFYLNYYSTFSKRIGNLTQVGRLIIYEWILFLRLEVQTACMQFRIFIILVKLLSTSVYRKMLMWIKYNFSRVKSNILREELSR